MARLSDLLKDKKTNRLSDLLGTKPSKVTSPSVDQDIIDITQESMERERQREALRSRPLPTLSELSKNEFERMKGIQAAYPKEGEAFDVSAYERLSPTAKFAKSQEESRISGIRERERAENEARIAEEKKPWYKKAIESPMLSKVVGASLLDKVTPGVSTIGTTLGTRTGQEFAAGVGSSIPIIGKALDPSLKSVREESTLPRSEIDLPLIGKTTIDPAGAGKLTGTIGFTAAQYGAVGKALEGLSKGSKVAQLLSKTPTTKLGTIGQGAAKFAGKQGVDLLADVIIQTPIEALDAIVNDDGLDGFAKTWATNRGIDALMNLAIGGTLDLASARKAKNLIETNEGTKKAVAEYIQKLSPEDQQKVISSLGVEVPLSPAMRQPDAFGSPSKLSDLLKDDAAKVADVKINDFKVADMEIKSEKTPSFEFKEGSLESAMKPGDASTFRNKVSRVDNLTFGQKIKQAKENFSDMLSKVDARFIDDTSALRKLEQNVKGGVSSAEDSIYKQARLFKGAPEAANEIVRLELKPAIKLAEDSGFNYKDLGDYAVAVHAKDVNDAGLKSGFSDQEIESVISKFKTPEMEQARKQLLSVSDRLLGMLKEDGLISQQSYDALKNKWANYMPLFRSFDDNKVSFGRGLGESFNNVTAPIKKLAGSDRDIIDPIESMVKNIYKTVDASRRNRIGLELSKLADIDVNSRFIRRLEDSESVGRKNVVSVTENGNKVKYEVEPEIYKVFNNLDKESSNTLIKILSKPASLLRAGATLTPEFAVRNPLRDIQNAFVVSKSGFNPVTDFVAGLASTMKKGDLYQQWLKEGGGYGNILSMDRQAHKEALNKIIKQPVTKKMVNVMSPKGMVELLRGISDITESATKVGEFRAALRSGASPAEAAFRSRDLMDFARAGSAIRPANRVVAFLNANIQGKSKLVRAIKENPLKVTTKMATSMVLPSIAAYAATYKLGNKQQIKTIEDAPDWLKNTFWLVPVPGTDIVARIPKPFDVSFAANGTERFLDYTIKNDKEAFDGFINQTIKDQSIPVMLTGVMPWIEGMANYSFFRQAPIIPTREQYIKREDQFDSRTSELAKVISKGARAILGEESNLSSPRTMDYILRTSAGGLGSTLLDATDVLLDKTGVAEKPPKPKAGVTQLPLIKGFTVNQASSGKSLTEFYDLKDRLSREKGSAKLAGTKFKDEEKLNFLNKVSKELSAISKQLREINESMTMTPEQKRAEIDRLTKLRNNIAIEAMKEVGQ